MEKMDLDFFDEVIDRFLKENTIHMIITIPKGTLDVRVQDNTGLGSVIQFYILLNSVKPILYSMFSDMGIDRKLAGYEKMVDALLGMIREEILCEDDPED